MNNELEFRLYAYGDHSKICDVIRTFDFCTENEDTREHYRNELLNSRMLDDDEDPDGNCSISWGVDCLVTLGALIGVLAKAADEVTLNSFVSTDEVTTEVSMVRREKTDMFLRQARSRFTGAEGELAQVAMYAYRTVGLLIDDSKE